MLSPFPAQSISSYGRKCTLSHCNNPVESPLSAPFQLMALFPLDDDKLCIHASS